MHTVVREPHAHFIVFFNKHHIIKIIIHHVVIVRFFLFLQWAKASNCQSVASSLEGTNVGGRDEQVAAEPRLGHRRVHLDLKLAAMPAAPEPVAQPQHRQPLHRAFHNPADLCTCETSVSASCACVRACAGFGERELIACVYRGRLTASAGRWTWIVRGRPPQAGFPKASVSPSPAAALAEISVQPPLPESSSALYLAVGKTVILLALPRRLYRYAC